jgi:hypothetical protein
MSPDAFRMRKIRTATARITKRPTRTSRIPMVFLAGGMSSFQLLAFSF